MFANMHKPFIFIFGIGLLGDVLNAQEPAETTRPPAAFLSDSDKYESYVRSLNTGGVVELITSVASAATGSEASAVSAWYSLDSAIKESKKSPEDYESEWATIIPALPTEIQAALSSQASVVSSIMEEFAATYTWPSATVTTRNPLYYIGSDPAYSSYFESLRSGGVFESLKSVASVATGREGSAVSVWHEWQTADPEAVNRWSQWTSILANLPTGIQSWYSVHETKVAQLQSDFLATFSVPPFTADPTVTANHEYFLPAEPEYYLYRQSLIDNGILDSLSSVAAAATGIEASAVSQWAAYQNQWGTSTVDESVLSSVFSALPTEIQSHIVSDERLRSKILATFRPSAGPWTETYASPGPEGYTAERPTLTTSPTAASTTVSGVNAASTSAGGAVKMGFVAYAAAVGVIGAGAVLL